MSGSFEREFVEIFPPSGGNDVKTEEQWRQDLDVMTYYVI